MTDDVKILIVEDEPILRELYVAILEDLECNGCDKARVDDVGSVEDAMPLLEKSVYDLVLTDFRLPGKNGIELIRKVSKRYPETSSLLISGLVDANLTRQALEAGAVSCLKKPCSLDDLLEVCRETIESKGDMCAGEGRLHQNASKHIAEILEANFIDSLFVDASYTIKMTNTAFEKEYGEHLGKKCHQIIGGNDKVCNECQAMAAITSGTPKTIIRPGRSPEGECWKIEERVEPWFDDSGGCTGLLISFTPLVSAFHKDIEEKKRRKGFWDNKYKQTAPFACVPKAEAVASFSEAVARTLRNPNCDIPALCENLIGIANRCDRPPSMKASIAAVVQPVLSRIAFHIDSCGANVETSLEPHLPMVHYSPPRLEQALLNVLWVAINAAPKGEGHIRIRSRQSGDMVALEISGNLNDTSRFDECCGDLNLDGNAPIRLIYASQLIIADGGTLEICSHSNGSNLFDFKAIIRFSAKGSL